MRTGLPHVELVRQRERPDPRGGLQLPVEKGRHLLLHLRREQHDRRRRRRRLPGGLIVHGAGGDVQPPRDVDEVDDVADGDEPGVGGVQTAKSAVAPGHIELLDRVQGHGPRQITEDLGAGGVALRCPEAGHPAHHLRVAGLGWVVLLWWVGWWW